MSRPLAMDNEHALLRLLNDGEFHSDEALAAKLAGVSPADVGRLIRRLERQGIQIQAPGGQGYRLAEPLEFLDKTRIEQGLDASAQELVASLEIHPRLESTNTHLMDRAASGLAGGSICFAERQTSGRGRLGRVWVSPYAANLYMSLLWHPWNPRLLAQLSGVISRLQRWHLRCKQLRGL